VVVTGTLPTVCYAAGMTKFLRAIGVRIFDYPQLASTLRDRVRERAASLARKPQPAQTVWQPGSMEWLAEQNKPNEPPPLRRLLALVETRELRPATIVSFAGGQQLNLARNRKFESSSLQRRVRCELNLGKGGLPMRLPPGLLGARHPRADQRCWNF